MSWSSLDLCLPYMHIEDIATILSLPNRISNPIVKRDLLQKFLVQLPWNPRYQLHFRGPFLHHSDFQRGHKWWWLLSRPRGEDAASQPREVRRFPKQATWQNDQWPSKYVHWFNADSLPHDCLAPQSFQLFWESAGVLKMTSSCVIVCPNSCLKEKTKGNMIQLAHHSVYMMWFIQILGRTFWFKQLFETQQKVEPNPAFSTSTSLWSKNLVSQVELWWSRHNKSPQESSTSE